MGAYDYPSPAGVAVDSSGNVYMADYYNSRVELFAAQHSLTTSLLTTGVDRGPGTILVGGVQSPCYAGCSETVGSSITVTASPSPGWYFNRWSTDDGQACSTATCTFSMPDNQVTLGATFTQTPVTASTPQVSAGTLSGFTEAPVSTVSSPPPAAAGTFPAGLLSFTISGLPIGGTVTVTFTLSSPLPPGPFSYWKFHGDTWTELPPSKASLDPTRTVITLTLTDGATPDDSDGKANGVIVDPGGPAVPNLSYVISLVPGWNLISLPLTPISTAIGTVLGSQISSEDFSIIWGYSGGKWSSATQSGGKITGTLTTIQDGLGYWIYMTKADNLTVVSSGFATPPTTPPSYPLGVGWNLVGFTPEPTIGQESTSSYLSSLDGNYGHIYLYDNSLGTWAENPTSLQPGQAVWVYVTAPATLTP